MTTPISTATPANAMKPTPAFGRKPLVPSRAGDLGNGVGRLADRFMLVREELAQVCVAICRKPGKQELLLECEMVAHQGFDTGDDLRQL